MDRGGYKSGKT